ncbi:MAG: uroporphyrinogen decarboxylase family protein, partial [Eubacterium sp.]
NEYADLIADPVGCMMKHVLPRMYSRLGKSPVSSTVAITKALLFEKNQVADFYNKIYEVTAEYGVPIYYGSLFYAPFDLIGDHLRGITQISMDLRRRKDELEAACEVLTDVMVDYVNRTLPIDEAGFQLASSWVHLPPMISPKHFEKFFWPSFKKVCDALVDKGHLLYLQFQGDYKDGRYYDYYAQLPENKVVIAVEHQDFKKTLDILGKKNMVSCSYPMEYLKNYSTKECIDKAKELLDMGMAHGRFYFGFNKPAFSFKDADPEKMKAVLNFVREYGKY